MRILHSINGPQIWRCEKNPIAAYLDLTLRQQRPRVVVRQQRQTFSLAVLKRELGDGELRIRLPPLDFFESRLEFELPSLSRPQIYPPEHSKTSIPSDNARPSFVLVASLRHSFFRTAGMNRAIVRLPRLLLRSARTARSASVARSYSMQHHKEETDRVMSLPRGRIACHLIHLRAQSYVS